MIDFAVVGAGAIAQGAYLPALQSLPTARIGWIVDLDEERASSLADRFDADGYATDDRDVVEEVDAVVIAAPPAFHAEIADRFLRADVHVFTEKPVATSAARGAELAALAAARDRHYAISRQLRESPACRALRAFCQNGAIGMVEEIDVHYGDETRWDFASDYRLREDLAWGGVLTDKAPHVLDLLFWILGESMSVRRYRDDSLGGLEANAIAELSIGDGEVPVTVEVTADRDLENEIRVVGTDGSIRADPHGKPVRLHDASGEEMILEPSHDTELTRFLPRVATQLDRFVTAVGGGEKAYVPASAGVALVEWMEACYDEREKLAYSWEPTIDPLELPEVAR